MKKVTITSLLALTIVCPAMAEVNVDITAGTNNPGCNNTVLHTYSGPTSLEAEYTANTINLKWYGADGEITTVQNASKTCTYDGSITLPTTNPTRTGYTFAGWQVRQTLDLMALIGVTEAGASYASINNNGQFIEYGAVTHGQSYYGITDNNTWAVDYGSSKGMLIGQGRCSAAPGTGIWDGISSASDITTHITSELGAEGGQYCYCNMIGYKDGSGNLQSLSSAWVFRSDSYNASSCAVYCPSTCAQGMSYDDSYNLMFRAAMLGSVQ